MKKIVILLLVVVLVAGAWTAGWLYAAGEVRTTIAALGGGDPDRSMTCEELEISGYPFRIDVDCAGATLVEGDVTTTLAALRGSVLVYNPTHAIFSARAPATFADAFTGSRSRLDFASAQASVRLRTENPLAALQGEDVRLERASLAATGVAWVDTLAAELPLASADELELHLLDVPEQHDPEQGLTALAAYATASGVDAPGIAIADAETSLEAELSGVPDQLSELTAPDLLQRWQQANGQLRLFGLKGTAAEDFIEATGTLTLDDAARPEGQVKIASRGVIERLGDLVPPEWQGLVLGSPADDGSYSQTLTLRGGIVLSGLIPVASLPPLL
ncbi:MAG TPA: DUF2125 domain-containing protein [Devosiaceae bacterium]|jgi:hypothetical protein|nr:DUF2125 domain-containing protein [Devosiaceae bacterium]